MSTIDIYSFGDLLADVQMQHIFSDQKTFVDAVPQFSVEEILEKYRVQKNASGFDLKKFVMENFAIVPRQPDEYVTDKTKNIREHIESLWSKLTRVNIDESGTLIPLPYPFIVPGGRFGEIYYWDSYFTMLGLRVSSRMDLVRHMINNFTYLIDTIGHIPNGNRSYFTSRSQPPYYAHMIRLLEQEDSESALISHLPQLLREYAYWMQDRKEAAVSGRAVKHIVCMPDGSILNRYWDAENVPRPEGYANDMSLRKKAVDNPELFRNIRAACESGWDFSSRWFADGRHMETICTTDIVPVDLNCLLWYMEHTIADAYAATGNLRQRERFRSKAFFRKNAIEHYLWDSVKGIYRDYNYLQQKHTASIHLAMAYPLFTGMANDLRAASVLQFMEKNMLCAGGLITTLIQTGQQWDAQKGWAPMQWVAYSGALAYREQAFAEKIRNSWCQNVEREFAFSGKILEKYRVISESNADGGGEYPTQDGFGWTNAIYLAMKDGT